MLKKIIPKKQFPLILRRADGTSTIEFAIIFPILLFVLVYGGFETWAMITTSLRINRAASHVASVASRADATLDEGAVTSLLTSANTISTPTTLLTKGRVILTAVEGGANGKILWQRCKGDETGFVSAIGLMGAVANLADSNFPQPPKDTTALIAETYYKFSPTLVPTGLPPLVLKHKSISLGREEIPDTILANGAASNC
jgi:Flp pilus assembly protein TadG